MEPFIIERTFNAPAIQVWKAITNNDDLKKWYFNLPEFKAQKGFEFSFIGGEKDGEQYTHLCRVTEVIPGKKLSYSWQYQGYEGYSEVSLELFDLGDQTRLVLRHTGLDSFPKHPSFARKSFEAGWTHIIGKALKEFVEA
ncbi:MAG: SRPBCC domain-containing protein [Chryseolinea sp.]